MTISFVVPIRTFSKINQRIHWAKRARQNQLERRATTSSAYMAGPPVVKCVAGKLRLGVEAPCVVTLVRVSPRMLDDDNLRGALKAVRDEIAELLGVDDRDPRVKYEYGQEKGKYGVRVEVRPTIPIHCQL